MLNNNILTRIYELQDKLAEIVNELDELEKIVNAEAAETVAEEEIAEVVEPREIVFEKDSPFYDGAAEDEELLEESDKLIALLEEAIGGAVQKTVINNSPITINIGGDFNLPIIGREGYANPLPIRRTARVKLPSEVVRSRHAPQKQTFKSFVRSCLKKGGR